ncbi:nitroreductase family protein [Ruminococcus gauvreauii]|uniref:Nitroreductase family protein n=1 Tax=Ruminococcus gauvreauii TaxID=438033 RepID=A0ABY5VHV5_9FIRM|nr:nitroreductase family protein [Ruminococcus gauvreauii]UWP59987.1 nitroreductase family protein [Ruminococcus gauvreauii]
MEFMKVIQSRQSCRAFTDEMVTGSDLTKIIQAGNAAPVANGVYENVQLTVIQNKELIAGLEENAHNAMPGIPEHPLYGLSTVISINCKIEENTAMAWANASVIAENMMLAATDLGLGSIYLMAVPVTAQYNPELCRDIKVQEGFAPYVMVGIGKPQNGLEERELTADRISITYI